MPDTAQQWESFAKFLAEAAPGSSATLTDVFTQIRIVGGRGFSQHVNPPRLSLNCSDERCDGKRFFSPFDSARELPVQNASSQHILQYYCSNCCEYRKLFAIGITTADFKEAIVSKIGEFPPFGPRVPSRVVTLIREDKEDFFKGYRCEKQGLGIGAFAYYRRIVENQKDRLFEKIIQVAKLLNAPEENIKAYEAAKNETQFKKAVESIKDLIPETLKVSGHSPLLLLHSALSKGLHELPDSECLDLARTIRLVLFDFAERLEMALKEHRELNSALSQLLNPASPDDAP